MFYLIQLELESEEAVYDFVESVYYILVGGFYFSILIRILFNLVSFDYTTAVRYNILVVVALLYRIVQTTLKIKLVYNQIQAII